MNCIQYTLCDTLGFSIDNTITTSLQGTQCGSDFIVVTGSSATCNNPVLNSRYCGMYLGFGLAGGKSQTPICG